MKINLRMTLLLATTGAFLTACGGGGVESPAAVHPLEAPSTTPATVFVSPPTVAAVSPSTTVVTVPPSTTLPATVTMVIGKWEWPTTNPIVYPYDVIVRRSPVPRNPDGSLDWSDANKVGPGPGDFIDILLPANKVLVCSEAAFVTPSRLSGNPIGTFPMWCKAHPANVTVPEPTESLTMMAQMEGMPVIDNEHIPVRYNLAHADLRLTHGPMAPPSPSDQGAAFRLDCPHSHFGFNDPIVYPGKAGASHLHDFCGNETVDQNSTLESLTAGSTTTQGGDANKSGYWTPAAINTKTHLAIPMDFFNYYKCDPATCDDAIWLPRGLKMIAGNKMMNTNPGYPSEWHMWWTCDGIEGSLPFINPSCPSGGAVTGTISFPNCWDGMNLDSADHRSHVVYSWGNPSSVNGKCPPSHPIAMVQMSINAHFRIPEGATGKDIKLSCDLDSAAVGGQCWHADVIANWRKDITDSILKYVIHTHMDYHNTYIGDYDGDGQGDWLE